MANRPDDFSEETKRIIASRVGYCCSRPDCQAPTCGPTTDTGRTYNIGEASHITAASDGGPRYDFDLTSLQRKHADNGIWMCRTHGAEIDRDAIQFPVDLLQRWKREAEERAASRMGKGISAGGASIPFVEMSKASRYGLNTMAHLADGSQMPYALVFELSGPDLTWFASASFVLRFMIGKTDRSKNVSLYEINAMVYEYSPLPQFKELAYALPQCVYPFLLELDQPINNKPRPCPVTLYCPPDGESPRPFVPHAITDTHPEVIDVRFTARESGVYKFALDVTLMIGTDRQTFRVFDQQNVVFKRWVYDEQ